MSSAPRLDVLRTHIEAIERRLPEGGLKWAAHDRRKVSVEGGKVQPAFAFGMEALDSRFAVSGAPLGGMALGAHQMAGHPGDAASALLFATLMIARRLKADPAGQALIVQEHAVLSEGGGLYGPGLAALGLDPGRLVFVTAQDGAQALRMVDEAVRSGAVSVVLVELGRGARLIDLPATQRFNLYGQQTSTLTLLVTPNLDGASAAMTRWRVRSAPSSAPRRHLGPPILALDLTRNRFGPVGQFTVEWSSDHGAFRLPKSLRAPVVRPSVHGPNPAGVNLAHSLASGLGADAQGRLAANGGR